MKRYNFRNLVGWQKAMTMAKESYRLIRLLPSEERFALADQMRRATISIPSNIAEGSKRHTEKDFIHFLSIAIGSTAELETQVLLGKEMGYYSDNDIKMLIGQLHEIERIIEGLQQSLIEETK